MYLCIFWEKTSKIYLSNNLSWWKISYYKKYNKLSRLIYISITNVYKIQIKKYNILHLFFQCRRDLKDISYILVIFYSHIHKLFQLNYRLFKTKPMHFLCLSSSMPNIDLSSHILINFQDQIHPLISYFPLLKTLLYFIII